ncbi:MAG: GAF domain-containing protein [Leptolyngbya sp. BL-A-14]
MTANPFAISVVTPSQILEGIAAIALQSQQSVALETILQTALETTRTLLRTDRVLLYRFLPNKDGVVTAEAAGAEWMPLLGQVIHDPCFDAARLERYRTGQFSAIEDIATSGLQACYASLLNRLQVQAALVVPLLTQDEVCGLLIAHHCQSARSWHTSEVQCLQMVAVQLGVAIQLHRVTLETNRDRHQAVDPPRDKEQGLQPLVRSFNSIYTLVQEPNRHLWFEFIEGDVDALYEVTQAQVLENAFILVDMIHPDDQAGYTAAVAQSAQTLSAFSHEWRVVLPSGKVKWLQGVSQPKQRPNGAIAWCGVIQDISDRKRTEAILRESEAHKSALISALPDLVMRVNQEGFYLEFLATKTFKVIGDTGDFVGTHVYDSLPHHLAQRRMATIQTALETKAIQFYEQVIVVDGTTQTEEVRVVPYGVDEVLLLVRDITDRKQAEVALRESEERSRLAFEAAHMGSWDWNLVTNEVIRSESLQRLTGMAPGTFDGRFETTMNIIHPDDRDRVLEALTRSIKQGEAYDLEFRFVKPDGSIHWAVSKGTVLRNNAGQPVRMLGVDVDVTDRKEAEIALWQRAEREQAINRVAQAIRQSLELQSILTAAATEIAQLLNVDQAAVVQYLPEHQCWRHVAIYKQKPDLPNNLGLEIPDQGNPFAAQLKRREIVQVIDAAYIQDDINQTIARELPGAWLLVPVVVDDMVWGSFSLLSSQRITCWQDEQVELVQALADQLAIAIQQAALYQQVQALNANLELQVQERTEQLQQALNFEALLKRITDHVRDSLDERQILQTAVQALALELDVDCCDAALYNMDTRTSTISYEHIRNRASSGINLVIPFEQNPELYQQVLRRQVVHCCVTDLVNDPQRNIEQSASILVCPLMDERGVLGDMWLFKPQHTYFNELEIRLVQQVANQCAIALRQSRLYQSAQAQVQELERLNQLKDDFLSTVSHELRTPMSNIKMATQMLEISLKSLGLLDKQGDPINRYFTILREEGQREIGLINDLLDLARLDAGTEPLNLATVALQPFLSHLAEPFLERTRKHQQQMCLCLPETLPSLTTDLSYLERILTELLHNACKYTPAGETITFAADTTATALKIWVCNSGVEIPAIERDRIFDKFYRIPNNDPWKHGGTGLGLTLVKKLAARLGASICVTSLNKQTTFTLEFLEQSKL